MLPLTRSRNRARFFGAPFSPEALFAGGTVAGAWYDPSDLSTLFTTSAGTTQCAMPGQGSAVSVGLMLDKSQGLQRFWSGYFDGTGDYLSFASDSGLAFGAGQYTVELWVYLTASVNFGVFFSVTGGLQFSTNASNNVAVALQGTAFELQSTTPVTLNQWVHLAVTRDSGNTTRIFLNGSQIASAVITTNYAQGVSYANFNAGLPGAHHTGYYSNLRVVKGTAVYTGAFTPPSPVTGLTAISGTSLLTCQNSTFIDNSGNNVAITVNGNTTTSQNIPLGNHAIAFNDTTARPELRARVNLVLRSEEFDNAYWTKRGLNAFGSGSVANTTATLDPIGGNAADYIQENTAAGTHGVDNNGMNLTAALHTYSVYVKAAQRTWAYVRLATTAGQGAFFDLTNGVVGTVEAGITASIASAGNGWYRCSVSITTSTAPWYPFVGPAPADNTPTYTGDGASGIYIWGADLRPANIGANVPAYQRIADANTYDTSGFPLYLRFDGIDDSMYTPANLNLSGTDKVSVFAGVRKLGTTLNMVAEFSPTISNNGTFYILGNNLSANDYGFALRGTAQVTYLPTPYVAPISNVLAVSCDIAGSAIADEIVPRINGVIKQDNPSGSNAGTGNFGTYPLYIGARNNSNLWFSGHLHSLIVVGSAVSAGNISATEQWVAGKMGIQI